MGITIHYSGKLDDPRVLPQLLAEARHFCFQRRWRYLDVDDRIIGKLDDETPVDDVMRGIIIQPHPQSESVFLTFNQDGELCFYIPQAAPGHFWRNTSLFTKTQFAPLDVHVSICELFTLIRDKYFPGLQVVDEGEYWETRDLARLAENFETLNTLINKIADALQDPEHPITRELQNVLDTEADDTPQDKREKKGLRFERGAKIRLPDPLWKRGHGRSAGRN
ncbi:MAG: hypothetical protein N2559_15750 [Anaerolineae bacterium]|nr:hypothetical protein [Anaerolineae bacterium]